tara:strand:+ start:1898 stop:2785 length:888 start_codon:yes stop_codon:yes gene_type:complete
VKVLTLGSMFAGIGGMELGFEATGRIETKWQVEIDDYANQILAQHWPGVARWKDVRTFPPRPAKDWSVDIIAGGFPCQDISTANGKAEGLDGERSGLFYEIIRVAGIIRPRAIVLENVAALYFRGLDRVLGELAEIGYDAEWHCVSAASVGAPHRRDRVFIIALANAENERHRERGESGYVPSANGRQDGELCWKSSGPSEEPANVADTKYKQFKRSEQETVFRKYRLSRKLRRSSAYELSQWATEPDVGRVANGVPRRVDRLKCLGNAIVPQVAEVVGRRLLQLLDDQDTQPNL